LHRRYRAGDYESWRFIAPIQRAWSSKAFEYGTWGGEIRAVVATDPIVDALSSGRERR